MSNIRVIAPEASPSVHAYFDVCPESPNGQRVVYARFSKDLPGIHKNPAPGEVVVCLRDGSAPKVVGTFSAGKGHSGAWQQWVDDQHVVYTDKGHARVVHVDTGAVRSFAGGCQMFVPGVGALFVTDTPLPGVLEKGMYLLDLGTGRMQTVMTLSKIRGHAAVAHLDSDVPAWRFLHPKILPGHHRVAFVLKTQDQPFLFSCTILGEEVVCFEGPAKPMHWHPLNENEVYGYSMHEPHRPCCVWDWSGNKKRVLHEGPGNHAALSADQNLLITDTWYGEEPAGLWLYDLKNEKSQSVAQFAWREIWRMPTLCFHETTAGCISMKVSNRLPTAGFVLWIYWPKL